MPATVIATIDSAKVAQQLIDALLEAGFKDQDVEILDGDADALVAEIVERGFGQDDARELRRSGQPRQEPGRGACARGRRSSGPPPSWSATRPARARARTRSKERRCRRSRRSSSVGKRKVASGGVRVTTSVSERPVEKTVTLREEAGRGRAPGGGPQAEARGGRGGVPGQDGRDARHQRGSLGPQGGAGGRRGGARQAGRGARGDGQGHRAPQRGRGREDQARLRQEALSVLPPAAGSCRRSPAPERRASSFRREMMADRGSSGRVAAARAASKLVRGPARSWPPPRPRWPPPPSTTATAPARSSGGTRPPGASSRSTASGCTTSSGARERRWCCSTATWSPPRTGS